MRRLFTLLTTIVPLVTFCQDPDAISNRKLSIGVSVSPDYTYRTLKAADATGQWIAAVRNDIETPKFGYTAGFILCTDFYKRFTFEAGLLFSDKGEKIKKEFISRQPDPIVPDKHTSIYHYYYLDIPVKANYYFSKTGSDGFFVSAGFSTNIFLIQKTTSTVKYKDGQTQKNISYNRDLSGVNFSFTTGLGYHHEFSNHLFLKAQPTFRHSITPILNAPINSYLYSVGLDIGFYYKL